MRDPFKFTEFTLLSFSGGRTSAYLLWRMQQAGMNPLTRVVFADTGRERPETYEFVREISRRWGVEVEWVKRKGRNDTGAGVVGDDTPFSRLLRDKSNGQRLRGEPFALPGPVSRFCSIELKRAPAERHMHAIGVAVGEDEAVVPRGSTRRFWTQRGEAVPALREVSYDQVLGIRADEPRRVSRLRNQRGESRPVYADGGEPWTFDSAAKAEAIGRVRYEYRLPLVDAGVVEADVLRFWLGSDFEVILREWRETGVRPSYDPPQGFDLALQPHEGNCDVCFEKATWKRMACIEARPDDADKWVLDEETYGTRYRQGGRGYAHEAEVARRRLPVVQVEDTPGECLCTD
jgi:3'-phosphoadenosine 5'-phosphosulfate sulfotransferase (PAPS reductase)/FAD synthetase